MMKDSALFKNLSDAMKRIPQVCATIAVNFSKERFRDENWFDTHARPWKPRKIKKGTPADERGILTKSGRLRRSIRKVAVRRDSFTIGSDVPYAKIHNEGGTVSGSERVRNHTRKSHMRAEHIRRGKNIPATFVKESAVSGFTRRFSRKFEQRQFIGHSQELEKRISRYIRTAFKNAIKRSLE